MAHDAAVGISIALVVLLVGVQPIRGRHRYRRLVEELASNPAARLRFYRRGIVAAWVAVGIVAVIGALNGRTLASIGLTLRHLKPGAPAVIVSYVVIVAIALAASLVVIWRANEQLVGRLRRQLRGFTELLPRTLAERQLFVLVAITAGICEEILYRGFGISFVRWLVPGASSLTLVVVIGIAFGFAHLYQGVRGVVLTGFLGGLFTYLTIVTGTLLPAIIIHVLVDLRVVFLPTSLSTTSPAPA